MTSSYPAALDTTAKFPATVEDDTDSSSGTDLGTSTTVGFLAQWMRDAGDAILKVEAELGIAPKGTFASVAARLAARSSVRKSADQTNATTTLANVTDLSFAVAAAQDYWFEFYIPWSSNTAGVMAQFAITFPAVTGYGVYWAEAVGGAAVVPTTGGAAATFDQTANASGTAIGGTGGAAAAPPTLNVIQVTRLTGILSNPSASGTIQVQAKAETTGTVTIKRGAYGELYLN